MPEAEPSPVDDAPPVPCPYCRGMHHPEILAAVEFIDQRYGAMCKIETLDRDVYSVPRAYISLHGLNVRELPLLATLYGWKVEARAGHSD